MPQIVTKSIPVSAQLAGKIQQLLNTVIKLDEADKGTLQVYDEKNDRLLLVACRGFSPSFCAHFEEVKPFDGSSCGRAFGIGSAVIISDVLEDTAFIPHRSIIEAEGFRAVKSVPVMDANGKKYGVVSTHYAEPRYTWNLSSLNKVMGELEAVMKEIVPAAATR